MEYATTIDAGKPFVKATYHLEGNGPIISKAYQEISVIPTSISTQYCPNNKAVACKLSFNPVCVQQLIDYAKACVQLAYRYFNQNFGDDLMYTVEVFNNARLLDPARICELNPSRNDIDQHKNILSSVLMIS